MYTDSGIDKKKKQWSRVVSILLNYLLRMKTIEYKNKILSLCPICVQEVTKSFKKIKKLTSVDMSILIVVALYSKAPIACRYF